MANTIAKAILNYKKQLDASVGASTPPVEKIETTTQEKTPVVTPTKPKEKKQIKGNSL